MKRLVKLGESDKKAEETEERSHIPTSYSKLINKRYCLEILRFCIRYLMRY